MVSILSCSFKLCSVGELAVCINEQVCLIKCPLSLYFMLQWLMLQILIAFALMNHYYFHSQDESAVIQWWMKAQLSVWLVLSAYFDWVFNSLWVLDTTGSLLPVLGLPAVAIETSERERERKRGTDCSRGVRVCARGLRVCDCDRARFQRRLLSCV